MAARTSAAGNGKEHDPNKVHQLLLVWWPEREGADGENHDMTNDCEAFIHNHVYNPEYRRLV
jgi:hypothetical protein